MKQLYPLKNTWSFAVSFSVGIGIAPISCLFVPKISDDIDID